MLRKPPTLTAGWAAEPGRAVNWLVIGGFIALIAGSTLAAVMATKRHLRRRMLTGELALAGVRMSERASAVVEAPQRSARCRRPAPSRTCFTSRGTPRLPQPLVPRRLPAGRAHRLRRRHAGDPVRADRGRRQRRLDDRLDTLVAAAPALATSCSPASGAPSARSRWWATCSSVSWAWTSGARAFCKQVRHLDHRPDLHRRSPGPTTSSASSSRRAAPATCCSRSSPAPSS